ncbi:tRNA adenosine deaminase-associated protein [Nocardioides sp.]|uniref:tRNA adenosine deaminase-associated protein n=1 Tax=Nocardioides sp. TaxID=35761 RepID=UPI003519100E
MVELLENVDFALAAYQVDGEWRVAELAHDLEADVASLAHALRRLPGEAGAVALIALDEDAFLVLRVTGAQVRLLLSDLTAALEWELAASALEHLGLVLDAEDDDPAPVGDLALLADLGVPASELGELLDDFDADDDLVVDELLSDLADVLGFGELFDDVVGLEPEPTGA